MTVSAAASPVIDGRRPEMRCYTIGPDSRSVGSVSSGDELTLITLDASGGQVSAVDGDVAKFDQELVAPLTGPVFVEGVEPDSVVGIEVLSVQPTSTEGYTWTRSALGSPSEPKYVQTGVREVALDELDLGMLNGTLIRLPRRVHVGTIGVAPASSRAGNELGDYGGNLDCFHVRPGAILWLTAEVAGALVFAGDAHASIGAGEVCGTGVEIPAEVRVKIHRRRSRVGRLPLVVDGNRRWIIGHGLTLDEAFEIAVREVLHLVEVATAAPKLDVYLAVSALLEAEICQVVNPRKSVAVSLSEGFDWLLEAQLSNRGDG